MIRLKGFKFYWLFYWNEKPKYGLIKPNEYVKEFGFYFGRFQFIVSELPF